VGRFLLKRLLSAVVTLWLLATIVFLLVNVLPSNVGRQVLGGQANEELVKAYNKKIGTDKPVLVQYGKAMKNLSTLSFGDSYKSGVAVRKIIGPAIVRSGKLALLALLLTVPLAIAGGVYTARRQDKLADRAVVVAGLATSSTPEFVTAAILLSIFCVTWKIGKVFANPPPGASILTQLHYLIVPAVAMAIVYLGYIVRMARAGVIGALQTDYARTATMKGLSKATVMRRHLLRNALAPTITVISAQIGYLFGSIVGVEIVFNYAGLGSVLRDAVGNKDIPILSGGVLAVGIVYMIATLAADLLIAFLNPRIRLETSR
jgi:peptide/nickel transport system permease protein